MEKLKKYYRELKYTKEQTDNYGWSNDSIELEIRELPQYSLIRDGGDASNKGSFLYKHVIKECIEAEVNKNLKEIISRQIDILMTKTKEKIDKEHLAIAKELSIEELKEIIKSKEDSSVKSPDGEILKKFEKIDGVKY